MTHKHTAGPWRVSTRGYTRDNDTKDLITAADGTCLGEVIQSRYRVESEANTDLITAAPELLEALRVLADHAQEKYPHFESERGQADIKAALGAIAKAEGRQ